MSRKQRRFYAAGQVCLWTAVSMAAFSNRYSAHHGWFDGIRGLLIGLALGLLLFGVKFGDRSGKVQ
jgi:hypothetical protein